MFKSILPIIILSLTLPTLANAGNSVTESLCSGNEEIVFSCSHDNKTVSLCSTKNLSPSSGSITYRFGTKNKIELEYPSSKTTPADAFKAHFESWAKGSGSEISFVSGKYKYVVYNRKAVYEAVEHDNGGGVRIYKNEQPVKDMWCKQSSIQDNMWERLHDLGLPDSEDEN